MDSIGLFAAWISVASFLFAIVVAIVYWVVGPRYQRFWVRTSRKRSEKRLKQLLAYSETDPNNPGTGYVAELVALYGSALLNLTAAIGLVIVSVVILDLGPSIVAAAALPFSIDPRWLTRSTGVLMVLLGYFFIFRLCYLGIQISRKKHFVDLSNREAFSQEISKLQEILSSPRR
jgi:hypothetical protein